jgi:hypothetical protein
MSPGQNLSSTFTFDFAQDGNDMNKENMLGGLIGEKSANI